jgi:hypothetical protein
VNPVEQELVDELIRLRRGFGLAALDLRDRLGPRIEKLCRITNTDNNRTIRTKILGMVKRLSASLSDDDRLIVDTTLGAALDIQHRRLSDRVDIIARHFVVAERTARRSVDRAFRCLAEEAAVLLAQPDDAVEDDPETGWYVRHVTTVVRLDGDVPELTEARTIVALRAGLKIIAIRYSLPRPPGPDPKAAEDLQVSVSFGAKIVDVQRESGTHYRCLLELPVALQPDEDHEYAIVLRPPSPQAMRTHYGLVPLVDIESFRLRVRFRADRHPSAVWRFERIAPRAIDDQPVPAKQLTVDDVDEVTQEFDRMERGYGYGIAWKP